ncbi:predicted protein [Chaetoceros tenuissimus]|uniref:Uncharacterized protein n=1 Tax=Chaetoceros tenuissimus TaxID=426638 RepID=A0AAD3HFR3_9STRA|nr:predicted protein [Chaetoceros tenuissimus]
MAASDGLMAMEELDSKVKTEVGYLFKYLATMRYFSVENLQDVSVWLDDFLEKERKKEGTNRAKIIQVMERVEGIINKAMKTKLMEVEAEIARAEEIARNAPVEPQMNPYMGEDHVHERMDSVSESQHDREVSTKEPTEEDMSVEGPTDEKEMSVEISPDGEKFQGDPTEEDDKNSVPSKIQGEIFLHGFERGNSGSGTKKSGEIALTSLARAVTSGSPEPSKNFSSPAKSSVLDENNDRSVTKISMRGKKKGKGKRERKGSKPLGRHAKKSLEESKLVGDAKACIKQSEELLEPIYPREVLMGDKNLEWFLQDPILILCSLCKLKEADPDMYYGTPICSRCYEENLLLSELLSLSSEDMDAFSVVTEAINENLGEIFEEKLQLDGMDFDEMDKKPAAKPSMEENSDADSVSTGLHSVELNHETFFGVMDKDHPTCRHREVYYLVRTLADVMFSSPIGWIESVLSELLPRMKALAAKNLPPRSLKDMEEFSNWKEKIDTKEGIYDQTYNDIVHQYRMITSALERKMQAEQSLQHKAAYGMVKDHWNPESKDGHLENLDMCQQLLNDARKILVRELQAKSHVSTDGLQVTGEGQVQLLFDPTRNCFYCEEKESCLSLVLVTLANELFPSPPCWYGLPKRETFFESEDLDVQKRVLQFRHKYIFWNKKYWDDTRFIKGDRDQPWRFFLPAEYRIGPRNLTDKQLTYMYSSLTKWEHFQPEMNNVKVDFYTVSLEDLKKTCGYPDGAQEHDLSFASEEEERKWKQKFLEKQATLMPYDANFSCMINESERDALHILENAEKNCLDPDGQKLDEGMRKLLVSGIKAHLSNIVQLLSQGPQKLPLAELKKRLETKDYASHARYYMIHILRGIQGKIAGDNAPYIAEWLYNYIVVVITRPRTMPIVDYLNYVEGMIDWLEVCDENPNSIVQYNKRTSPADKNRMLALAQDDEIMYELLKDSEVMSWDVERVRNEIIRLNELLMKFLPPAPPLKNEYFIPGKGFSTSTKGFIKGPRAFKKKKTPCQHCLSLGLIDSAHSHLEKDCLNKAPIGRRWIDRRTYHNPKRESRDTNARQRFNHQQQNQQRRQHHNQNRNGRQFQFQGRGNFQQSNRNNQGNNRNNVTYQKSQPRQNFIHSNVKNYCGHVYEEMSDA